MGFTKCRWIWYLQHSLISPPRSHVVHVALQNSRQRCWLKTRGHICRIGVFNGEEFSEISNDLLFYRTHRKQPSSQCLCQRYFVQKFVQWVTQTKKIHVPLSSVLFNFGLEGKELHMYWASCNNSEELALYFYSVLFYAPFHSSTFHRHTGTFITLLHFWWFTRHIKLKYNKIDFLISLIKWSQRQMIHQTASSTCSELKNTDLGSVW